MDEKLDQLRLFADEILEEYDKGKDELNMAEFPLALAGKDPTRRDKTSASYRDLIRDKKTGKEVERVITIQGSDEFGLPTYYDEEILFGVLQLTNVQRSGDNWPTEVRFSRYHLAKILGLKTDGRTYRRIWDSLHRLANTTYNFRFSFFDKQEEEWRPSVVINFIQTLTVHGGPIPGRNGEVTVRWNEDIHRNFQAGYLRNINFSEYRSIGLPLAKALYRYLGKHFYRTPRLKLDLKVLAYEKLGLSRSHNVAQIKRALGPAIERLEQHGFLKPLPKKERFVKVRVGEWKAIFEKMSPQSGLPMAVPVVSVQEGRLIDLGVSPGVSAQLVENYPSEVIERKIDEINFLTARGKGPKVNPGAWLAKSIKEAWDPPPDYQSPEERQRDSQKKEEELIQQKEESLKKLQAQADYQRISEIRDKAVTNAFDRLIPEEVEQLRAKVLKDEPNSEFADSLWKPLVRLDIAERLENEGKIPALPEMPEG